MKYNLSLRAGAIATILVGLCSWAALAEPGGGSPLPVKPEEGKYDPIEGVATKASDLWDKPGFGSVQIDHERDLVIVRWHGERPTELTDLATSSSSIKIEDSKLSQDDVDRAAEAIFEAAEKLNEKHGTVAVRPNSEMSGAIIELQADSLAADDLKATQRTFSAVTEVPFSIELTEHQRIPMTRQNDSSPWQGGGAIGTSTASNTACSTGFSVLTSSGEGRLLTAAHCNFGVGTTIRDGNGDHIGAISARKSADYDAALIDPSASPATVGKVFGGPWNAGTSHAKYQYWVAGAGAPSKSSAPSRICTSGAVSGENCSLDIYATGVSFPCGNPQVHICKGFRAKHTSATGRAVAQGDSGGPIIYRRDDGRVGARGIISNGLGALVSCGSTSSPALCTNEVEGIGIHRIFNAWPGLKIEL